MEGELDIKITSMRAEFAARLVDGRCDAGTCEVLLIGRRSS